MSEDVSMTSKHFRSYLELFRCHVKRSDNQTPVRFQSLKYIKRRLLEHLRGILHSIIVAKEQVIRISNSEKLSSMREIDVFGPQAGDSRIMSESWQVRANLGWSCLD